MKPHEVQFFSLNTWDRTATLGGRDTITLSVLQPVVTEERDSLFQRKRLRSGYCKLGMSIAVESPDPQQLDPE
jgi:hypothetical protein